MRAVTFIACGYAVALWTAATFFGLSDDVLFFHSDALTKAYFLAALGFLFLPAALIPVGAATLLGRRGTAGLAAAVPLALLLAGFLLFGGESVFGKIKSFMLYLACLTGAIALAALIIWRLPNRAVVLARAAQLSRVVLFVAAPFVLGAWIFHHVNAGATGAAEARHVVMILVDGMPSQLLARYAPDAPPTALDRVAERGCVIDPAYTSRTYTSGYFSVLYSGDHSGTARDRNSALPHALEAARAGFRWMSFHANGFPETARLTGYGGLRSALLTERWTWLPRLLGLHYHVFLTWDETRRYMGSRVDTLYRALNGRTDERYVWEHTLPAQIREMQSRYDRSFLLLHVSITKHTVQALADGSYGDQAGEIEALIAHATANDYTYKPEQARIVETYRDYYRKRIDEIGKRVEALLDVLKREGRDERTLVLVTADHGSTFSDGKLWYGHHPDEEVARVPLLLFGGGIGCAALPVVDTLDMRATIDGYLGVPSASGSVGRNLAQASAGRARMVPVLTVRKDKARTWFLEIYPAPGTRYLFNLHPDGDGRAVKGAVRGYNVEGVPLGNEPAAWDMLAEALRLYRIDAKSIHAGLRDRVGQSIAAQPTK